MAKATKSKAGVARMVGNGGRGQTGDGQAGNINDAVREAVQALESNGRLTPDAVLKAAQNPLSPLHGFFEWDDTKAAELHRIEQARGLIRSVRLVITTENREVRTVYYVRDPRAESSEQGYVSLPRLRTERENAIAMLRAEFTKAESALERAESLADALELTHTLPYLRKRLTAVRGRIEHQASA